MPAPGPGGGYAAFAGRDATRAFVSGQFEGAGLTDDVSGLSDADLKALVGWRDFYHKARARSVIGLPTTADPAVAASLWSRRGKKQTT